MQTLQCSSQMVHGMLCLGSSNPIWARRLASKHQWVSLSFIAPCMFEFVWLAWDHPFMFSRSFCHRFTSCNSVFDPMPLFFQYSIFSYLHALCKYLGSSSWYRFLFSYPLLAIFFAYLLLCFFSFRVFNHLANWKACIVLEVLFIGWRFANVCLWPRIFLTPEA